MENNAPISSRSLLESFKVAVSITEGFGEKIPGHISYGEGRKPVLNLALIKDGEKSTDEFPFMPPKVERAIGVLETGEYVTLQDMDLDGERSMIAKHISAITVSYKISKMFVGYSVCDKTEFEEIDITFRGLLEWMNQITLKINNIDKASGKFSIDYSNPQIPMITLDDGTAVKVSFYYSVRRYMIPVENFVLPQPVVACLRPESSLALRQLCHKALQLKRLVMLVTDTPMPLASIQLWADGKSWMLFKRLRHDKTDEIEHSQLKSYYTDIEDFRDLVNRWFELYRKHEKSLKLYFETKTNAEHMIPDIKFLRFAQSLEAFHREDDPESDNLAEALESLLQIPYEILETSEVQQFIKNTTNIRNYLSHGILQRLESDMPDDEELEKLADKLELVMYGNLIHELPMPEGLKSQIIERKRNQLSLKSYESC